MNTKVYKLTKENINTCLYYYDQINEQTQNFYTFLKEYKDYTKEYHKKLG